MQLSRTSLKVGTLHERERIVATVEFTRYIPRTMSYIVTCSVNDKHILKFFTDKKIVKGKDASFAGWILYHQPLRRRVRVRGNPGRSLVRGQSHAQGTERLWLPHYL